MCSIIDPVKTGRNIKQLMAERGMTARDIQQRLGFSERRPIYFWIAGKNLPSIDNLAMLAEMLRVSIDDMLIHKDESRKRGVKVRMDASIHQPGKLDFLIEEKDVSVTEFRRRPSAVWTYLETVGHVIFFTRRGKRDCAIMSIETHACLSGDYEKTMREVEEATAVWHEERKAKRRMKKEAQHDSCEGGTVSEKSE